MTINWILPLCIILFLTDSDMAPAPFNDTCINVFTNETITEGGKWTEEACTHCVCEQGKRICAEEICQVDCPPKDQVVANGSCCPTCAPPAEPRDCVIKGTNQTHKHQATWKPDDCTRCTCDDGESMCAVQDCAPVMCQNPVTETGQCCPKCRRQECFDPQTKKYYKDTEKWTMKDGCTSCFCMGGYPMCVSPGCALDKCRKDVRHVKVEGICCPVCEDSAICETENGQKFVEGNHWQKGGDCKVCSCSASGIVCTEPQYDEKTCQGSFVKLSQKCSKVCLEVSNKKEEEDKDDEEDIFP